MGLIGEIVCMWLCLSANLIAAATTTLSISTELSAELIFHTEAADPELTPVAIRATSTTISRRKPISSSKRQRASNTKTPAIHPTTSSTPPIPIDCVNHPSQCAACNNHHLIFPPTTSCEYSRPYTIVCDRTLSNVEHYAIIHDPSGRLCAQVCDQLHAPNGCAGVLLPGNGTCVVATGCDYAEQEEKGMALLRPDASPCSNGSSSLPPATCSNDTELAAPGFCETCDGYTVKWGQSGAFEVQCDTIYTGVKYLQVLLENVTTVEQCILACQAFSTCYAPVIAPNGTCVLAVPNDPSLNGIGIAHRAGYAVLEPRFTGFIPPPFPTTSSVRKMCQPTSISCPTCDDAYATDASNTTYHIFCDNQLYSESGSLLPGTLSAAACLALCDNLDGCGGATFHSGAECQLARGEDVFPQSKEGFTAFLSVNLSYTATDMGISAFPGGEITTSALTLTDVASTTTTPTPKSCKAGSITCSHCNGTSLTVSGEAYVVQCNFRPVCADITFTFGRSSQQECLRRCDADAQCLAAIYMDGRCNLCEGGLEGLMAYRLPEDYVVFVAQARASLGGGVVTGTTLLSTLKPTTTMSAKVSTTWTSSKTSRKIVPTITQPSATFSATGPPARMPSINDVSCPGYDNFAVVDPTDGRHFYVLCNAGLGAAFHRSVSATDFAACAAHCTADCGGLEFGLSTRCELYTSISVVEPIAGATAGVHIFNPGPEIGPAMTVTRTGVLPGVSASIGGMAAVSASATVDSN